MSYIGIQRNSFIYEFACDLNEKWCGLKKYDDIWSLYIQFKKTYKRTILDIQKSLQVNLHMPTYFNPICGVFLENLMLDLNPLREREREGERERERRNGCELSCMEAMVQMVDNEIVSNMY